MRARFHWFSGRSHELSLGVASVPHGLADVTSPRGGAVVPRSPLCAWTFPGFASSSLGAIDRNEDWLYHPCAVALLDRSGARGRKDVQLSLWAAAHADRSLGFLTLTKPLQCWAPVGSKDHPSRRSRPCGGLLCSNSASPLTRPVFPVTGKSGRSLVGGASFHFRSADGNYKRAGPFLSFRCARFRNRCIPRARSGFTPV